MQEDLEKILFHERTILSRIDELAREIADDYRGKDLVVVAVLNGALMFVADLLRRLPLPLRLEFIRASSYDGTESSGNVRLSELSPPAIAGRHVLVVDDILDTGFTLHAIRERLRSENPADVRICVLLRKRKDRGREVHVDYVGFDLADEFVVGYGLDYRERYRNLPFIGVLRAEIVKATASPRT